MPITDEIPGRHKPEGDIRKLPLTILSLTVLVALIVGSVVTMFGVLGQIEKAANNALSRHEDKDVIRAHTDIQGKFISREEWLRLESKVTKVGDDVAAMRVLIEKMERQARKPR